MSPGTRRTPMDPSLQDASDGARLGAGLNRGAELREEARRVVRVGGGGWESAWTPYPRLVAFEDTNK